MSPICRFTPPSTRSISGRGWTQAEYDRKIDWTQRIIRLLHPDIFGFQELWHAASLTRALQASGLADDYDLLVPEGAKGTHIVCAAIVRKELLIGKPAGS